MGTRLACVPSIARGSDRRKISSMSFRGDIEKAGSSSNLPQGNCSGRHASGLPVFQTQPARLVSADSPGCPQAHLRECPAPHPERKPQGQRPRPTTAGMQFEFRGVFDRRRRVEQRMLSNHEARGEYIIHARPFPGSGCNSGRGIHFLPCRKRCSNDSLF